MRLGTEFGENETTAAQIEVLHSVLRTAITLAAIHEEKKRKMRKKNAAKIFARAHSLNSELSKNQKLQRYIKTAREKKTEEINA